MPMVKSHLSFHFIIERKKLFRPKFYFAFFIFINFLWNFDKEKSEHILLCKSKEAGKMQLIVLIFLERKYKNFRLEIKDDIFIRKL